MRKRFPMEETEVVQEDASFVEQTQAHVQKEFYYNFTLLTFLYMLQGVPLGLAGGSLPFLLKSNGASYTAIGLFGMSMLPFSLKLGWAPIVDGYWIPGVGRRKTWIIPCQVLSGIGMILISYFLDTLVLSSSYLLGPYFFCLVLAFATQDIAVDGWALEILDPSLLSYASTAQSVGQNVGFFLAFTVFLGANSFGWISLGQFVFMWGVIFIGSSILLYKFKYEPNPLSTQAPESIKGIYKQLWDVARLPDVKELVFYLLTFHAGLVASDRALHLRFIECGFSKELLATLGLAGLPLSIGFAVITGKLSQGGSPMSGPFFIGNLIRYLCGFLGLLLLWSMGDNKEPPSSFMVFLLFLLICLGTLGSSLVFVSLCAYFNQISPKHMGGSFLTFLNTCSNLGKSFWAPIIMYFIDMFSFSTVNLISLIAGTLYLIKSRAYLRRIEDTERMQFSKKEEGKI